VREQAAGAAGGHDFLIYRKLLKGNEGK